MFSDRLAVRMEEPAATPLVFTSLPNQSLPAAAPRSKSQHTGTTKRSTRRKKKSGQSNEIIEKMALSAEVDQSLNLNKPGDDIMLEFDQYVLYHELKKKTDDVLSSQEQNLSQGDKNSNDILPAAVSTVNSFENAVEEVIEVNEIDEEESAAIDERNEEECFHRQQKSFGASSGPCSSVISGNQESDIIGDIDSSILNVNTEGLVFEYCKDVTTSGVPAQFFTPDEAASSDEEVSDVDCKEEDYLFPTPDEVDKSNVPQVGKVFNTLDEAKRFINVYALSNGFGIKKGRNHKNKKITFVCNKSRKTMTTYSGTRKRRRNVLNRTNCQMHV